jgi:hypothetical protein
VISISESLQEIADWQSPALRNPIPPSLMTAATSTLVAAPAIGAEIMGTLRAITEVNSFEGKEDNNTIAPNSLVNRFEMDCSPRAGDLF